jgi:hypothetical protein
MRQKYEALLAAYSEKNLTILSAKLIELYKNKNKHALLKIAQIVSDYKPVKEGNVNSIFSQLMLLYHPDRSSAILGRINDLIAAEKPTGLKSYLHILELGNIDDLVRDIVTVDESEFEEAEEWEAEDEGYEYFEEEEEDTLFDFDEPDIFDFYQAVKKKIYGNKKINFPPHYLEEFEEIEMSVSGITDLGGVEHCKFVQKLHLNNNEITDIENLMGLENLEELFLSGNRIGFIDALESLENLRILDLSFNEIDDIEPLYDLEKLEYVNLLGNPVPMEQIENLRAKDIVVVI